MNESTTESICKYYAEIKAYQYKLNKLSTSPNVLNKTIASVMYLLQSAGESLQAIEVSTLPCIWHALNILIITVQQL